MLALNRVLSDISMKTGNNLKKIIFLILWACVASHMGMLLVKRDGVDLPLDCVHRAHVNANA